MQTENVVYISYFFFWFQEKTFHVLRHSGVQSKLLIRKLELQLCTLRSAELKTTKDFVGLLLFNQEKIKMTNQASAKQQAKYKQTFDMFDVDQSGRISSAELGKVMEQLGQQPSEADLHAMVSEVDADGDGEINFEEFLTMMARRENTETDEIKAAFEIFDKNQDGFISATELSTVMESLGEVLTS